MEDEVPSSTVSSPGMHISIRFSLLAGVAVPFLYFGAQAIAALFFPNFNVLIHTASALGSDLSPHPAILNCGAALSGLAALSASYGLFGALRGHGVWAVVAGFAAACSVSIGLASLWAASYPLPDPRHNSGALGAGAFAAPFIALVASLMLKNATKLKAYLVANVLALFVVAAVYAGLIHVDLRLYGGAVQRLGALVMFVPIAVLCAWLLIRARPDKSPGRTGEG